MYGAFKVLARDFDGDGDYDLAAITHYPDVDATIQENFLYFENKTQSNSDPFEFEVFALPELKDYSFVSMDAGDLDGDGDLDIALGGNNSPPVFLLNQ
jgi:type IV secretory pathway VirB6-like protein